MTKAPPDSQQRLRLPRRHQPDLVAHVRHDQHLRSLPPPTPAVPEPDGSIKRRGCRAADAGSKDL